MRKLLIAVGSAIALALPGALQGTVAAQAAGAPNACKLTGVTKALAAKLYGKGASIASSATEGGEPPNLGATCGIDQAAGAAHYIGGIYVEPYSGEEFSALLASYGQLTQTPLKGLGPGAVFAHDAEPANDVVLFKAGSDAILLSSIEAGGVASSHYPTESMYIAVAHAVHQHLG